MEEKIPGQELVQRPVHSPNSASTLSDPLVPAIDLNYEIFTVILCFW